MSQQESARTVKIRVGKDGRPMMCSGLLSVLCGVPVEEIRAAGKNPFSNVEWTKAERRRKREAQAETGSYDLIDILKCLADRDGTSLEFVYQDDDPLEYSVSKNWNE